MVVSCFGFWRTVCPVLVLKRAPMKWWQKRSMNRQHDMEGLDRLLAIHNKTVPNFVALLRKDLNK
jgi:hypothetical protein